MPKKRIENYANYGMALAHFMQTKRPIITNNYKFIAECATITKGHFMDFPYMQHAREERERDKEISNLGIW